LHRRFLLRAALRAPFGSVAGPASAVLYHGIVRRHEEARDPRVLDPVEQLIGPDILCWSTIFWIKDAGSKSFVSWHQDNTYWGLSSRNVVTAWFAISEASVDAGWRRRSCRGSEEFGVVELSVRLIPATREARDFSALPFFQGG
jgi:hypothetical protein